MELNPHDSRHWPFIGSVVDYLGRRADKTHAVPDNIALPFPFSSRRVGEVARAGPYAAFLGGAFNPVWTEFRGKATRHIIKTLQTQKLDVAEPYVGIAADGRFEIAGAADPPPTSRSTDSTPAVPWSNNSTAPAATSTMATPAAAANVSATWRTT